MGPPVDAMIVGTIASVDTGKQCDDHRMLNMPAQLVRDVTETL